MRGKEENNLLSLVLQIAMYKFRGKRDLGEVVHVTYREPTGPASEKTGSSTKYSSLSFISGTPASQTLILPRTPVALLEFPLRAVG